MHVLAAAKNQRRHDGHVDVRRVAIREEIAMSQRARLAPRVTWREPYNIMRDPGGGSDGPFVAVVPPCRAWGGTGMFEESPGGE